MIMRNLIRTRCYRSFVHVSAIVNAMDHIPRSKFSRTIMLSHVDRLVPNNDPPLGRRGRSLYPLVLYKALLLGGHGEGDTRTGGCVGNRRASSVV